jgi:3-hydroxybutyryl-CoA dehydratase
MSKAEDLEIGAVLRSPPRQMTRERMRWYVDAQPTVAMDSGRIERQEPTIHDDDEYAKSQGLPGIIADGMVSTNWIMGLLIDRFGDCVARKGRLRTKYIKPIYEDDVIVSCARVTSVEPMATGETAYRLEVWCETKSGDKVTVGEATVIAAET